MFFVENRSANGNDQERLGARLSGRHLHVAPPAAFFHRTAPHPRRRPPPRAALLTERRALSSAAAAAAPLARRRRRRLLLPQRSRAACRCSGRVASAPFRLLRVRVRRRGVPRGRRETRGGRVGGGCAGALEAREVPSLHRPLRHRQHRGRQAHLAERAAGAVRVLCGRTERQETRRNSNGLARWNADRHTSFPCQPRAPAAPPSAPPTAPGRTRRPPPGCGPGRMRRPRWRRAPQPPAPQPPAASRWSSPAPSACGTATA